MDHIDYFNRQDAVNKKYTELVERWNKLEELLLRTESWTKTFPKSPYVGHVNVDTDPINIDEIELGTLNKVKLNILKKLELMSEHFDPTISDDVDNIRKLIDLVNRI